MKIKPSYLSMTSGINENKISRLLAGLQEESSTDMEKIARGLGKNLEFFLADTIIFPQINTFVGEQKQFVNQLVNLMENIDEVLSAKSRFSNIARE